MHPAATAKANHYGTWGRNRRTPPEPLSPSTAMLGIFNKAGGSCPVESAWVKLTAQEDRRRLA